MQDLTLVGVHDDGEHLVLAAADGERFRLALDEPLRAAVRRDRARLSQLQLEQDGGLRPRDIQARIRAGHTAEQVAAAAGVPVEHVRRFEGPVLAEREHVARQARAVRLRRPGYGSSASPTLGELVSQRLTGRDGDDQALGWDAWREEDGTWVVCLAFTLGEANRRACWTYDAQLRHVTPRDDEARWLTDEQPVEIGTVPQRRLSPVRDGLREWVYDVEADGGVRLPGGERLGPDGRLGPEGRSGSERDVPRADRPTGAVRAVTVDLLDTLRERRGRRQTALSGDEDPDRLPADPIETAVDSLRHGTEPRGVPVTEPRTEPAEAREAGPDEAPSSGRFVAAPPPHASKGRPNGRTTRARPITGRAQAPETGSTSRVTPSAREDRRDPGAPAATARTTGHPSAGVPGPGAGSGAGRSASPSAPAAPGAPVPAASPAPAPGSGAIDLTRGEPGAPVTGAPVAGAAGPGDPSGSNPPPDDPPRPRPSNRRQKRASVPSWDDIVFGSRRE